MPQELLIIGYGWSGLSGVKGEPQLRAIRYDSFALIEPCNGESYGGNSNLAIFIGRDGKTMGYMNASATALIDMLAKDLSSGEVICDLKELTASQRMRAAKMEFKSVSVSSLGG